MSDLGYHALRLALLFSLLGFGAGLYAGLSRRNDWTRAAEHAVWVVLLLVTVAMAVLFHAFATNDFQLAYVASHSARSMTIYYRLAALWGGQAGSLLLWAWMLSVYGGLAVWFHRRSSRTLMPWVVAILLANAAFFLVLLNFVTSPFEKLPPNQVLSDGSGLNPLLQHPAMMIHPVMLYTGFVGFVVPFAFGLAALITKELGTAWFQVTRRWTLFAWFFLAIGILLGGRWAYEVLGWGGYWAWDPVENASFMPWLAATAYLHSVMIQEKRDMLKTWNLTLIGLTYTLCLFGTFLTRSGVVQSVHSFTDSGWFGFIFLGYVGVVALSFFAILIARRPLLQTRHRLESTISREASFILNNWVFMVILAVVFWGTMFPVFSEWFTGERIMVGPAFFNSMTGPLALLLLFLTGVGPLIAWRRASLVSIRRQFLVPALLGLATAAVLSAVLWEDIPFHAVATWALSVFVVGTIVEEYARATRARTRQGENAVKAIAMLLRRNQRRYGGYIVHLGVVFILVGAAGSAFNEERLANVQVGESIQMNGYALRYLTARPLPKGHYGGAVARLALYENDEPVGVMTPEKRMYWLEQQPSSIPAIHSRLNEDLYVILTAVEEDGSATFKVHRNPLVNWIWLGGLTFVIGTIAIMWPFPEPGRRSAS